MNDSEPAKSPVHGIPEGSNSSPTKRYFFDLHDGETSFRDDAGIDLANADAVPVEAYDLLRDLVQDQMPEGRRTLTVRVRDETGSSVYVGEMTVEGRRFKP